MSRDLSRRARWRGAGLVSVMAALFAAVVCSTACTPRVTLSDALASPEALARAVLEGMARRDGARLQSLALSEDEFRDLVWPKLPTSRPGRNIPRDYVWKDLHGKSGHQLQARLNEWEDRGFTVVAVSFTGEITDYETFRVFRESRVTLRDRDGRESTGRLFGSVIEQAGRYKVFSYIVD